MAGPEAEGRGRRREVASELCLYLGLDHRRAGSCESRVKSPCSC